MRFNFIWLISTIILISLLTRETKCILRLRFAKNVSLSNPAQSLHDKLELEKEKLAHRIFQIYLGKKHMGTSVLQDFYSGRY